MNPQAPHTPRHYTTYYMKEILRETDIIALGVIEQLKKDLPNPTVMYVKTPPSGNFEVVKYELEFATELNKSNIVVDVLVRDGVFTVVGTYAYDYSQNHYEMADPAFPDNLISNVISYVLTHHYLNPTISQKNMDAHKSLIKGITEQLQVIVQESFINITLRPTYTIDPRDWTFTAEWEFKTTEDEIVMTIRVYIAHGYLVLHCIKSTAYELADPVFPRNLADDIIRKLERWMLVD
jgi:hypothetical protein